MMKFLLFSVSLVLLLAPAVFAQTQSKTGIPFELLPSGHILVKAEVDGVQGSFIFDTGAGLTVFTKAFFHKLPHVVKEDGGYTGFRATGERLDIDLFFVNNVVLGGFRKAKEEVSWVDINLGGIDGIISLKLLETQPFTIDFTNKVIHLESAQTLAGIKKTASIVPIQLEQSRGKSLSIFSYFKVNDTLRLQLALDSGAGKDVFRLNAKYLASLQVNTSDTAYVRKIEKRSEINGSEHVSSIYITLLKKLSSEKAPAVNVTNFPVQFVEGLIYDGIIWINWLGAKITFDLAGEVLLVRK